MLPCAHQKATTGGRVDGRQLIKNLGGPNHPQALQASQTCLDNQTAQLADSQQAIAAKTAKLHQQAEEIEQLREKLNLALQRRYGKRHEASDKQLPLLFDEITPLDKAMEAAVVEAEETITVPAYQRRKRGRKPLPKELPRTRQVHDIPEADKICACGCQMTVIGEEVSEQLDIIPAKVQVIAHVKLKYGLCVKH